MKSYKRCPHYDPKTPWKCMIHDLCRERDIPDCPIRTRWSQGIAESDVEFAAFCMMNPIGVVEVAGADR